MPVRLGFVCFLRSHPDVILNPQHQQLPQIRDSTKNHQVPSLNLHQEPMFLTEDEMDLLKNPDREITEDCDLPELALTRSARRYAGGGNIRGPIMDWMHRNEDKVISRNAGTHTAGGGAQF